jgi:hypothetical protein
MSGHLGAAGMPLPPLAPANTVEVARLRHRLALGLHWTDALAGTVAQGQWHALLEKVGPYPVNLAFDNHGGARHALRNAGLLHKRFVLAAEGGDARCAVRVYAAPRRLHAAYERALDSRLYVPRRIRFTPAVDGNEPAATVANIRRPWLWPGAAYPLPGNATAVRGRVLRGPDLASAQAVPWARIVATVPASVTVFGDAQPAGYAHGDDRGEFVLALENRAVGGAALAGTVEVRLWAYLPPPGVTVDDADPLASLPLEEGGGDSINAVLRGHAAPPGYVAQAGVVLALRVGETAGGADATLLFA